MVKFHFIDDMHVPNRVNCEHNQLVILGLVSCFHNESNTYRGVSEVNQSRNLQANSHKIDNYKFLLLCAQCSLKAH